MATCFCGCGREIDGLRAVANNEAGQQMARDLAVMRGALQRDETGVRQVETEQMVAQGTVLVDAIVRYLHGEAERGDLDKGANKDWMKRGRKLAQALASSSAGPPWLPDDDSSMLHLAQTGTRAQGVISAVSRDGWGNERVASLEITVTIAAADGTTSAINRSVAVAVYEAPRVGDQVEVAYDPAAPDRFLYRPLVPLPPAN
ncbi:MAG: hypothetical protein U0W40_05280 [Acidimicrobiia bacterium]